MTELEKLKKERISEIDDFAGGWNACIDHLAALGRIVPENWKAIPPIATKKMMRAIRERKSFDNLYQDIYQAMFSAAPKPFESEEK